MTKTDWNFKNELGCDRILNIAIGKDGSSVDVSEACDYYYDRNLSKEKFQSFINKLQEINDLLPYKPDTNPSR